TLSASGCLGGGGSCLVTNSPPFPGLRESGLYQLYEVTKAEWGFFTGTFVSTNGPSGLLVSSASSPFVYLFTGNLPTWVLAVPQSAPAAGYPLTFTDNSSGEVVATSTRTDPPNPGTPTDIGITTNVPTRPYLMAASPFKAFAFQLPVVQGNDASNPSVSFALSFASSANLRLTAGAGTTATDSGGVITVTVGDAQGYAPVLSDGSFDLSLDALKTQDLSSPADLRPALASGGAVSVSYPLPAGGTGSASYSVPAEGSPGVTDKLSLSIRSGGLHLVGQPDFGKEDVSLTLYTAMDGAASALLGTAQLGGAALDLDLSSKGLSPAGVLFASVQTQGVDVAAPISVTFDMALQGPVTADTGTGTPAASVIRLVEKDTGTALPITLAGVPSNEAPRQIAIRPVGGLKPGTTYDVQLWALSNGGHGYPVGTSVEGSFTTFGAGADVGSAAYTEVGDIARRGSILYMALEDQGYDILDSSDPANPATVVNGPVSTLEAMHSVAIAPGVPIVEGSPNTPNARTVMALVGGGGGGKEGVIRLYYADFPEDTQDQAVPQTAAIGAAIGGAKLCDAVGSGTGHEGTPEMVRTLGSTAFVSIVGVGLEEVDLAQVAESNRNAVLTTMNDFPIGSSRKDISMTIRSVATVAPQGSGQGSFVLAAAQGVGLLGWQVPASGAPVPAGSWALPSCPAPTGSMRMQAYPNVSFTHVQADGTSVSRTRNLLLVAGGNAGVLVYGFTQGPGSLDVQLLDVVPTASPVYDTAMDTRRMIVYAATYSSGVTVINLPDPVREPPLPECAVWAQQHGAQPYGFLDLNGDGVDDRIVGTLPTAPGSNATLVVDSETGLLYVGEKGTAAGLHVVGARPPRMEFVLGTDPGPYQIPGYLSAFDGDKPRLALWLPGGAGPQITGAQVELYDRKGFEETPQVIDETTNPPTTAPLSTVIRTGVTLTRQSSKRTDSKYNFYLEAQGEITLGMLYDPSSPDPTLMVSKQSGSLRGTVGLNGWWGSSLQVEKAVSRPWIEWTSDELIDDESETASCERQETTVPSGDPYFNSNGTYVPSYLALGQARNGRLNFFDRLLPPEQWPSHYENGVAELLFVPEYPGSGQVVVTPKSEGTPEGGLRLHGPWANLQVKLEGIQVSQANQGPASVSVLLRYATGETKAIQSLPIWVFESGMAVDYNRDGNIDFDSPITKSGPDHVPDGKYYEFWGNDDCDNGLTSDGTEDDMVTTYKDSSGEFINSTRDLEDFTRLWIRYARLRNWTQEAGALSYRLRFSKSSTASIKLFEASSLDGGLEYLQDADAANAQLAYSSKNAGHDHQLVSAADDWTQAKEMAGTLAPAAKAGADGIAHYIFDGVGEGQGDLELDIVQGQVRIAHYSVPLNIRPISDFYEEYTVGRGTDDDPDQGPLAQPVHIRDSITASQVEGTDYILYVHGWNMGGATHKERWAETAYKRLWWLGYKGRFGLFRWPCRDMEVANFRRGFNESEQNAWISGMGLMDLLNQLKGKGYSVDVLAHSQGNVVVAGALREAKDTGATPPLMNAYVATQAALSSSLFESQAVDYFHPQGRSWAHWTPIDALAHFPAQNPFGNPSDQPFMAGTGIYARNRINMYNTGDYAVGDNSCFLWYCYTSHESAWEANNSENRPWPPQKVVPDPWENHNTYRYNSQEGVFWEVSPSGAARQLDPLIPFDRFKILSFAAQSYGVAVGAGRVSYFKKADDSDGNVDLAQAPTSFGQGHYEHDEQFMYTIQQRWPYWKQLMADLGITPAPWGGQ
ncbi:MAG: hypothetical protein WBS54_02435, partial [Acidobacteriota bacterium]